MITDKISLASLESYLRDPVSGAVNLGGQTVTVATAPLPRGKQIELKGVQLLIEHEDLQSLMGFQLDAGNPPTPAPLFRISVIKEMFPGLFADAYSHRVHNVAGFIDCNDGQLTNARVLEVDGVPTIVSTRAGECGWMSRMYMFPEAISIDALAWELATSRLSTPDSFHYRINLIVSGTGGVDLDFTIDDGGAMFKADARRAVEGLNHHNVHGFRIGFEAKVFEDTYLNERHVPFLDENLGRPLLRAFNVLQPIKSIYEVHSLTELQHLCSEFRFFDTPGPELKRLVATLDLNAVLVNSVNQSPPPDPRFERIELELLRSDFSRFEAKMVGVDAVKVD
jgi:hypothetical protein